MLLTGVSVGYLALPEKSFELPRPTFQVANIGKSKIVIPAELEFFLTMPFTPFEDTVLGSGRIRLTAQGADMAHPYILEGERMANFGGRFLASEFYESLFNLGAAKVRFALNSPSGTIGTSRDVPFDKDWLTGEAIFIELK